MLYRLSADRASFKTIEFGKGLNIILADRQLSDNDERTPERRTRNGAGKSSIIDLVHFLLAGGTEGAYKSAALAECSFELSVDVRSERLAVRRALSNSRLSIKKDTGAGLGEGRDAT